ncbi:MAG: hypothetical protein AAGC60_17995 [Acidobacteriota bacterium]
MPQPPRPPTGAARATTPAASTRVVVAFSLALVLAVGLVFLLVGRPLADTLDRLVAAPAPEAAPEPAPQVTAPTPAPAAPVPTEPEPIRWTLTDVETAIEDLGTRAEALIAEGRDELRELDDPSRARENRRERVLRRWALWARTWRNRLEDLEAELPPEEACTVHASMQPACTALQDAFAVLAEVPQPLAVDGAVAHLDDAAERLDLLLRPPPPPEEPEEGAVDEEGDLVEGEPSTPPAQG